MRETDLFVSEHDLIAADNDGMFDLRPHRGVKDVFVPIPEVIAADEGMIDLRELYPREEVNLLAGA